jgi:hypothetical protein
MKETKVATRRSMSPPAGPAPTGGRLPSQKDMIKILERARRRDPIGLIQAKSQGSLAQFLAEDLITAGYDPKAIHFG